jgi:hypothetical protein
MSDMLYWGTRRWLVLVIEVDSTYGTQSTIRKTVGGGKVAIDTETEMMEATEVADMMTVKMIREVRLISTWDWMQACTMMMNLLLQNERLGARAGSIPLEVTREPIPDVTIVGGVVEIASCFQPRMRTRAV